MAKTTQKTFVTSDQNGPVECLGMTFPNEQARREYFMGELREKLKDPEFRSSEGFPIGEDEDILAMADPPYYTACPNPFMDSFVKESNRTGTQVIASGAVKQDLIIFAYKPTQELEEKLHVGGAEKGVWGSVEVHLAQLPVFLQKRGRAVVVAERQAFLLFDRMVAFYVQRGFPVPLAASEFYQGLRQRFPERDEMFFLPSQVTEYDRKRSHCQGCGTVTVVRER